MHTGRLHARVDDDDRASADRRAHWVALRTLHQRPTVVGRTDDGATVYEVRSVRLVLGPSSGHFSRLLPCARCGRDAVGSAVSSTTDLDRVPNSVFCRRCARSGGPAAPARAGPGPAGPALEEAGAETLRLAQPDPAPARAQDEGDERLVELAAQVGALAAGLDELRAEVAESDARARSEVAAMAELMAAQRAELAQARHDAVQAALAALAEPLGSLAKAHDELEQRLGNLGLAGEPVQSQVESLWAAVEAGRSHLEALEQRIDASLRRLTRVVGAQAGGAPEGRRRPPAPRPDRPNPLDALDAQLRGAEERLARLRR